MKCSQIVQIVAMVATANTVQAANVRGVTSRGLASAKKGGMMSMNKAGMSMGAMGMGMMGSTAPPICPFNNFVGGECLTTREIGDAALVALFFDFDVDAATPLIADTYIQHNPGSPTGAAPLLGFLPALQDAGLTAEVHRTIEDGNLVAYHTTYTNAQAFGGEVLIGFDVFRVEDGQVQEHWDNLQIPADTLNPSGRSMVDGATEITDLDKTEANRAVVIGFINDVLIGGNSDSLTDYISSEMYIQHNPTIGDGLDGLATGLQALAEMGMAFVYESLELIIAQGNFVLTGSQGTQGGESVAFYDLFRLENGLIVEHWDVIQTIPPESEFAHSNGKF